MNYYFDESGNWQEPFDERNKLLIGGLLIKENYIKKELKQEFTMFKNKHNLSEIHATDIKDVYLKEQLYKMIYDYVKLDEVDMLVHYLKPKALYSRTLNDPDDLYIDIASKLISDITFGDTNLNIEYDMKFHYAYPLNVLDNLNYANQNFTKMKQNFILSEDGYKDNIQRIQSIIKKSYKKTKEYKLKKTLDLLNISPKEKQKNFISNYLWSEFNLKSEKPNIIKERFKDKIEQITKQKYKDYGLEYGDIQKPNIKYKHKQYQSEGVQIIDIICNLVWKNGDKVLESSSSTIKGIYENITIKDIANEI
ncbi:MAG: hypothetical protein U9Q30_04830 [Campylobacterota bacterium]|nr:hypothetical protein [Campylobacterota bacterium]